jgi:hypothetical protein
VIQPEFHFFREPFSLVGVINRHDRRLKKHPNAATRLFRHFILDIIAGESAGKNGNRLIVCMFPQPRPSLWVRYPCRAVRVSRYGFRVENSRLTPEAQWMKIDGHENRGHS